jgi:hypothetical protein
MPGGQVISAGGASIADERPGAGPAVVLVGGAVLHRACGSAT